MNKYLIAILKIQSSVILPSFGSLMITNTKTGKIAFNPHLKFNDGSLAKFIAEKEGTDEQAASNQIAKFVREIEAELGKGNSYDMFEFGSFSKDKDGNIAFKMDPKGAILPAATKTESKAAPVKESPKVPTPPPVKGSDKKVDPAVAKGDEKTKAKLDPKAEKAALKAKAAADKKAAKEKAAKDKAASKLKAAEEKAAKKAKAVADKLAAKEKIETDKLAAKAKANPVKPASEKPAETKVTETDASKQDKNKFVPTDDKSTAKPVNATPPDAKLKKDEKKSAVERAVGDSKVAADIQKPAIKAETKKDTTQDKNSFKPTDDKKAAGTSKAATTAIAAKTEEEKGMKSIKDKYKKSATTDKKQKPAAKPAKGKKEKKEKKKKSKLPLIIILIILLGGGGTAGYIYKDKIMAMINGEAVAETSEDETEGDEIAHNDEDETLTDEIIEDDVDTNEVIEDEIIEDEVIEDEVVETVVDNSTGGNYHVIGNAFAESSNADNYVSSMKSAGYGSAKVLGRFDNLYMVSIQQFDSRSSAASGASKAGDGAWVFKYPK